MRAIDLQPFAELSCPIAYSSHGVQRMVGEGCDDFLDGIALCGGTEEGALKLLAYGINDILM
jgi:hypothetical protein